LTARIGFTVGLFMKRFCTVLWGLFGLIAIGMYDGMNINPDYIWGTASRDLLGGLHLGLMGLMIVCLLGALMSTTDTLIVAASGILTNNCYRSVFPRQDESHYLKVGRVMGVTVLIGGALIAIWFDSMLQLMKFIWEFNTLMAAAFWCGMKWRRSNRMAAWSSMIVTLLAFIAIPLALPGLFPEMRANRYLLKQVSSTPDTRVYAAHQADVDERNRMIKRWETLHQQGRAEGIRPTPVKVGETLRLTKFSPKQPIFWSKGLKDRHGRVEGDGMLYVDMVLIDQFFDLSKNSHALNETIRTFLRIILPLIIMIIVSLSTRMDGSERLDRFYVKMRTPVCVNKEEDRSELEKSYANPARYRERLLFPNSNLELFKWNKIDIIGFGLAVLCVFGIIGLLHVLLHLGA
jgi:SSS family solute:Na+ symporter